MIKKLLSLFVATLFFISCNCDYNLKSSELSLSLDSSDDELFVSLLDNDGNDILAQSPISYKINDEVATWRVIDYDKKSIEESIPMHYGEFSEVRLSYTDMVCNVELTTPNDSIEGVLTIRLFDNAMAYRLELKDIEEGTKIEEISSWKPADKEGLYFATNGEHEPIGGVSIAENDRFNRTPIIYRGEEHTLAFHECDLVDYPQLFIQGQQDGETLAIAIDPIIASGEVSFPWRTVMVGDDIEDLHNLKPIYQTMSRPAQGDFDWVKPGLCMWDWRVKGTTFDGFTYKMNDESLKRYIDFCAKSNIAYFLIDAEWYETHDPLSPVSTLKDIREVIAYGKQQGVGTILYYDLNYIDDDHPKIDFNIIARYFADLGATGVKYGFLKAPTSQLKTTMTHEIIEIAANNKLIVDFHDAPIPFSGLERTYPNYINREYCHAQLDRRTAFNPRQFVKMACINLLAGHMDQTNGTFALNEMATRSKGPRNEYPSTVSAEAARFLFTHTGSFSIMIDAPEAYSQKEDLFEVIKSLPAKWDETLYLDMEYNSHVAVAKRSGKRWFAAVIYGENGDRSCLELDFLTPDTKYKATIFRDADDTDMHTNKEAYEIESREVCSDDNIEINVVAGGGYSVIFEMI